MRNRFLLFTLLVVLAGWGLIRCKQPDALGPNLPPSPFSIKATPSPGGNDVVLNWTSAKDPNGDPVTYSVVYKDTLIKDLIDTTFTIPNVGYYTTASGSVIARDNHGASTTANFILTTGSQSAASELVRFVKPDDGRSLKNGLSWATAYDQTQLQTAINSLSVTGGQVWVAQGVYKPTTDVKNQKASFSMRSRVAVYGGFSADTTTPSPRNPSRFPTILSGDIDEDGTPANNSNSVVRNVSNNYNSGSEVYFTIDSTAVLDGFTITGGNGGEGGGIYNYAASPTILNCIITGNTASAGGGMYNTYFATPYFINCLIAGNSAGNGGGIFNYYSGLPRLINCIIRDNMATGSGGGIDNVNVGDPVLINCTITGNSAAPGKGGALASSTYSGTRLINCILWNNGRDNAIKNYRSNQNQPTYDISADHCLIEAESVDYVGSNNLKTTVSPFRSANSLELLPGSLAIDRGNNESYFKWKGPPLDFIGNPRIINQLIDVGAIEHQ